MDRLERGSMALHAELAALRAYLPLTRRERSVVRPLVGGTWHTVSGEHPYAPHRAGTRTTHRGKEILREYHARSGDISFAEAAIAIIVALAATSMDNIGLACLIAGVLPPRKTKQFNMRWSDV
jgi:hypothetical protein